MDTKSLVGRSERGLQLETGDWPGGPLQGATNFLFKGIKRPTGLVFKVDATLDLILFILKLISELWVNSIKSFSILIVLVFISYRPTLCDAVVCAAYGCTQAHFNVYGMMLGKTGEKQRFLLGLGDKTITIIFTIKNSTITMINA